MNKRLVVMSNIIKTPLNLAVKLFESLIITFSLSVIIRDSLTSFKLLITDVKEVKINQSLI